MYLHYYAMLSQSHAAKFFDQLINLKQRVEETNKRKQEKRTIEVIRAANEDVNDNQIMDRLDVKWLKKPDTLTKVLEKLDNAMRFHGFEEVEEQFEKLEEHNNVSGVKFASKRTFKKWMDPSTRRGMKNNKYLPDWNVIKGFIKNHPTDEDVVDNGETKDVSENILSVAALPPTTGLTNEYLEITDSDISRVMDDCPTEDNIGELLTSIRYQTIGW